MSLGFIELADISGLIALLRMRSHCMQNRWNLALKFIGCAACFLLFEGPFATAQAPATPYFHSRIHYSGDIWLNVQAMGTLGSGFGCFQGGGCLYQNSEPTEDMNALRIYWQPSLEYPGGSKTNYLYLAGVMFGCIKDGDTLVSSSYTSLDGFGHELLAFRRIEERSWLTTSSHFHAEALADQEYRTVYSDTSAFAIAVSQPDVIDQRSHKPIGIEVLQTSRSWSDGLASRFIIFDLWFKNISGSRLRKPALGLTVVSSAGNYEPPPSAVPHGPYGTVSGF
jgi:hypothetical protein